MHGEAIRGVTVSKVGLSHISASRSSRDLVFWVPYARAVEMRGATSEVGVGSVWTEKERELHHHIELVLQSGQALSCIKSTFFSISAFFLADQHGRVGDSRAVEAVIWPWCGRRRPP